jgi:hypothetical protein
MQRGPLKIVICGRRQYCSKIIRQPGVCCYAVLSVVRKMSEAKVHVSVEQCILIKFLTKEGCKPLEICSVLKKQYGEKTVSNVSVYKWSSAFKKGRETVENEPHERRPRSGYEGGPKRNWNRSLVGGPVVVHASAARGLLRGPFCISQPTGIAV